MSNDSIYTDGSYAAANPGWHEEDSAWKASKIAAILERNEIVPKNVVEVGCGAGEVLRSLSEHYPDSKFEGYEISGDAFRLCEPRSSPNLNFFHSDFLLKEGVSDIDLVMAIDVFEHVEDFYGFLRSIKEKGRYKVFHIPLDLSVQSILRVAPILKMRNMVGHIHYFTKETALAALRDTDYTIVDQFYTAGGTELPDRGWKANAVRLPRKLLFSINQDLAVRILGGYSLMVLAE